MQKHTPGPWKIGVSMGGSFAYPWPCYRLQLMGNPGDTEEVEATRRLIEAAPDLLAALEVTLEAFETFTNIHSGDIVEEARAAIAKCSPS